MWASTCFDALTPSLLWSTTWVSILSMQRVDDWKQMCFCKLKVDVIERDLSFYYPTHTLYCWSKTSTDFESKRWNSSIEKNCSWRSLQQRLFKFTNSILYVCVLFLFFVFWILLSFCCCCKLIFSHDFQTILCFLLGIILSNYHRVNTFPPIGLHFAFHFCNNAQCIHSCTV